MLRKPLMLHNMNQRIVTFCLDAITTLAANQLKKPVSASIDMRIIIENSSMSVPQSIIKAMWCRWGVSWIALKAHRAAPAPRNAQYERWIISVTMPTKVMTKITAPMTSRHRPPLPICKTWHKKAASRPSGMVEFTSNENSLAVLKPSSPTSTVSKSSTSLLPQSETVFSNISWPSAYSLYVKLPVVACTPSLRSIDSSGEDTASKRRWWLSNLLKSLVAIPMRRISKNCFIVPVKAMLAGVMYMGECMWPTRDFTVTLCPMCSSPIIPFFAQTHKMTTQSKDKNMTPPVEA
mmetsp:Transcript_2573/g.6266  ORF Transcript_2573/g.6266 Transcript_2573/m.6266 type:complete len:292 (+) Transcript_2573:253-1128(+)